jgi:hypothetical protein
VWSMRVMCVMSCDVVREGVGGDGVSGVVYGFELLM